MKLTITTILFGLPGGQQLWPIDVVLPAEPLRVGDLIARKVTQEVSEVVAQQRPGLSGEYLSPETLILTPRREDWVPGALEDEIARAQQAFTDRAYMIVVDNQRVWDADVMVTLKPQSQVEFIKILPIVGG